MESLYTDESDLQKSEQTRKKESAAAGAGKENREIGKETDRLWI